MRFRRFLWVVPSLGLYFALGGCSQSSVARVATAQSASYPGESLYRQVSSGSFQLNTAVDALIQAMGDAGDLAAGSSEKAKKFAQIRQTLDRAGEMLGDYPSAPSEQAVAADPAKYRAWKDAAAIAANKALGQVMEAEETASFLSSSKALSAKEQELSAKLTTAEASLRGAVSVLVGNSAP